MEESNAHCDAMQSLKKAGLSRTPQRIAVLDVLIGMGRPVTATDILHAVNGNQRINKVTVYRILASFRERRIIREIPTHNGINYYEMACVHNPLHPHFYCRCCKIMYCLDPLTVSGLWDWLTVPHTYTIEEITVGLSGLCHNCKEKQKSNAVAYKSQENGQ
jgi:Fur family ferric uptake transcriptional regulator